MDAENIDPTWTHVIKLSGKHEARKTGNGSRMLHKARKKHVPCSNTLNHVCFRILTSLGILKGYNQWSDDVTNAHAHATPPKKTYLKPDDAIKEFYEH